MKWSVLHWLKENTINFRLCVLFIQISNIPIKRKKEKRYKTFKETRKSNQKTINKISNRSRQISVTDVEIIKENFKVSIINMLKRVEAKIKNNERTKNIKRILESMKIIKCTS